MFWEGAGATCSTFYSFGLKLVMGAFLQADPALKTVEHSRVALAAAFVARRFGQASLQGSTAPFFWKSYRQASRRRWHSKCCYWWWSSKRVTDQPLSDLLSPMSIFADPFMGAHQISHPVYCARPPTYTLAFETFETKISISRERAQKTHHIAVLDLGGRCLSQTGAYPLQILHGKHRYHPWAPSL